jgi:hypothetical protein
MCDTQYAMHAQRPATPPNACAMISFSLCCGADRCFVILAARRSKSMRGTDRSTLSCRPLLFLLVTLAIPGIARAASLEDSAKELSVKITAMLPNGQPATCEIRNHSSLGPDEVSRIERVLKAEVQGCGAPLAENARTAAAVIVTLSENWKELVWTAEIRQADAVHAVLLSMPRTGESHFTANAMHVTVRSEKFWEGPERILDAAETSNGVGKSWLVLLLPASLAIQDLQTGTTRRLEVVPAPSGMREPWGRLGVSQRSSSIWFTAGSQTCNVDLDTQALLECLPKTEIDAPPTGRYPMSIELVPGGTPPPGKGFELRITPLCGGTDQFLATSARDYTQTDSLQVFQVESNGPVAMSGELDFPGPIMALHMEPDANRAIVRNLVTGNYEAYRLDISCGQ